LTDITHTIVDHSFNDISLNYTLDNSNNFYALRHIGSLGIKLLLHIEQLAYYDIQIKFTIDKQDTNEYVFINNTSSYVSAVYMNLTNNNLETLNNITSINIKNNGVDYSPGFNDFSIVGSPI
jgi:aspartyl-tRNA synthetase